MPRYFFEVAYHGGHYNGWQSQKNATGVQTIIEEALSKLMREQLSIVGSGRTDTGVHCEQQFFHCDINKPFEVAELIIKLNSLLPQDIAIHSIRAVSEKASARYDAVQRTYHYEITRRKDPFLADKAWHFFKAVDIPTMNAAAALLVGEHDFTCFSKVKTDVNHFRCTVHRAEWREEGSRLYFTITANRFLRGMVRAIVGTLLDIGTGKITIEDMKKIIASKDRKQAGANVPPQGLFLSSVVYPEHIFIN